jgi:alcohol dehydrogenase
MPTYYFLPTRNVFGEGAVQEIGTLFGSLHASRAMIVTDKFLAQSGMAEKISGILAQRFIVLPTVFSSSLAGDSVGGF